MNQQQRLEIIAKYTGLAPGIIMEIFIHELPDKNISKTPLKEAVDLVRQSKDSYQNFLSRQEEHTALYDAPSYTVCPGPCACTGLCPMARGFPTGPNDKDRFEFYGKVYEFDAGQQTWFKREVLEDE